MYLFLTQLQIKSQLNLCNVIYAMEKARKLGAENESCHAALVAESGFLDKSPDHAKIVGGNVK